MNFFLFNYTIFGCGSNSRDLDNPLKINIDKNTKFSKINSGKKRTLMKKNEKQKEIIFEDIDKLKVNNRSNNNSIKIIIGGDAMLGRSFNDKFEIDKTLNYADEKLNKLIDQSDGVICNLETTITNSNQKAPKTFNFKLNPIYKEALKKGKIKYVSIANNHILDYGEKGMNDTINNLDSLSIKHAGADKNYEKASSYSILELKDIKIGFLSLSDHYNEWKANKNKAGIWYINIESGYNSEWDKVEEKIKQLKNKVDFVVVSLHWNYNYVSNIKTSYVDFAHKLIDAGVNIIHGHSPHHILPIEKYKNGLIFYSLGAYIDDYAVNEWRNDLSFIAELTLNRDKDINMKIIPIKIKNMKITTSLTLKELNLLEKNINSSDINNFKYTLDKKNI